MTGLRILGKLHKVTLKTVSDGLGFRKVLARILMNAAFLGNILLMRGGGQNCRGICLCNT